LKNGDQSKNENFNRKRQKSKVLLYLKSKDYRSKNLSCFKIKLKLLEYGSEKELGN